MGSRTVSRVASVVALAVVLALSSCGGGTEADPRTPSRKATGPATLGPSSVDPVTVQPGTYRVPASSWAVADFTVTLPRAWTVQYGAVLAKNPDEDDEVGFYPVVVEEIYKDACRGEGVPRKIGPRVDDLVAALRRQPGPRVGKTVETTLGGYPATRVDLEVPRGLDLADCRLGGIGLQVWHSAPADKYFVLLPDGTASVYVLDVQGRRQVFLAQHRAATSDRDLEELDRVLDSVIFQP